MKELIEKLARGVIEYDVPVLEVSVSEIDKKVYSEKSFKSSFTVFSSNDVPLKGFVYSSNEKIVIEDKTFAGKSQEINFSIATEYINDGDEVNGEINVVSNGGEVVIPDFVTTIYQEAMRNNDYVTKVVIIIYKYICIYYVSITCVQTRYIFFHFICCLYKLIF